MSDEIAVGIDLGTSNSCVSMVLDGMAQIVPNEWGERIHASVVSFLEDGSVLVGNEAKRNIITNSEFTVYSTKRLIGRYFFSDEVKKAQAVMPYEIVEGPNNGVRVKARGQEYAVSEVSALVLKEMKAVAERYVGVEVKKAVVTVPAFFNDNQRQATKDAGRIAGLDVLRIINEPTAAALAYGLGGVENQRAAIYDLGGGTFDVSILEIGDEGVFEVLSTAGDTYLGGDDFDDRIMNYLADIFQEQYNLDLRQNKYCLQVLKEASEQAKIDVGRYGKAEVYVEGICQAEDGQALDLVATLDEETFNGMVMDLVQRTFKVCDEALQAARLTANEIDAVVLVGGPTRLPVVSTSVGHYFQTEPLSNVDPDEVVALGAAVQADALCRADAEHFLLDVTPLTLRIATVGGYTEPIIDKNSPIPVERTRSFTTSRDGQDKVRIKVMQGESSREEECEMLGQFEFSGFRIGYRGEVTIEVTFEIDTNGIVNVTAADAETGQRTTTRLTLSSGLSEEDIEESRKRTEETELASRAA